MDPENFIQRLQELAAARDARGFDALEQDGDAFLEATREAWRKAAPAERSRFLADLCERFNPPRIVRGRDYRRINEIFSFLYSVIHRDPTSDVDIVRAADWLLAHDEPNVMALVKSYEPNFEWRQLEVLRRLADAAARRGRFDLAIPAYLGQRAVAPNCWVDATIAAAGAMLKSSGVEAAAAFARREAESLSAPERSYEAQVLREGIEKLGIDIARSVAVAATVSTPPPAGMTLPMPTAPKRPNALKRTTAGWDVFFDGTEARLPNRLGFQYIALLLRTPRKSISAGQLMRSVDGSKAKKGMKAEEAVADGLSVESHESDADPAIDWKTENKVKATLASLKEDYELASEDDPETAAKIHDQIDQLEKYLSAATGLPTAIGKSGRKKSTRDLGSPSDKVRKAVSDAIVQARKEIERVHPRLGLHLKAIRMGRECSYEPDRDMHWEISVAAPRLDP